MSKKIKSYPDMTTRPPLLTALKARMPNGVCRSAMDGSVWLYKKVPLAPVTEAKDDHSMMGAMAPLYRAYTSLASLVEGGSTRRFTAKSSYRNTHLLSINIPVYMHFDAEHPISDYLNRSYGNEVTNKRLLLFGVRLVDKVGGGSSSFTEITESLIQFFADGEVPLGDFDEDLERIDTALTRSGLVVPTSEDFKLAESWWNQGESPDVPTLHHVGHMHVFHDPGAMRVAEQIGTESCDGFDVLGDRQSAVTMASLSEFDFDFNSPTSHRSSWLSDLLESGALAVSVRGLVEPPKVTREELRRQRKRYLDDIQERGRQGKLSRAEQDEKLGTLEGVESHYATGSPHPTLVDSSVTVGFGGIRNFKRSSLSEAAFRLAPMTRKQGGGLAETWLCSNIRANPNLHDVPIQVVAASGATSLSHVGDFTGALFGITERDRQPAFLDPGATSRRDTLPLSVFAAATGAGKELPLSTPLMTPFGTVTMGEVKPGDTVMGGDGKPCTVVSKSEVDDTPELYEISFSDGQKALADANHQWWVTRRSSRVVKSSRKNRRAWENYRRWSESVAALAEYGESLDDGLVSMNEIASHVSTIEGIEMDYSGVHARLRMMDCEAVGARGRTGLYRLKEAVLAVALRLSQQHQPPRAGDEHEVMSTAEMLAEGVELHSGHRDFAVDVTDALQLPEADLPVDPWLFGVWLGDGGSWGGQLAVGRDDLDWTLAKVQSCSESYLGKDGKVINIKELGVSTLKEMGVYRNKHIPMEYLRASEHQRIALLQGLMDTDGTIGASGGCELTLSDERLANDALSLIRSLGIKASKSVNKAGYRDTDGEYVACKDRHRIKFTTDKRVFRMPRKAERLPEPGSLRATSEWNYITDIQPVPADDPRYEAAACITVDSPDNTYLIGDSLPTHNTMAMLNLADQFARMGVNGVVIDPKQHSRDNDGLGPAVMASGGQVISLDDIESADGILDPLRLTNDTQDGIAMAQSIIFDIDPWAEDRKKYEQYIGYAIAHGVKQGATCTGQALRIAQKELPHLPPEMFEGVFQALEYQPLMAAMVGSSPETKSLAVSDGITLIEVGNSTLDLPNTGADKSSYSLAQRLALAMIRMMVMGSAYALASRGGGFIFLDEAWTFLKSGSEHVEKLGRIGRAQSVFAGLFTQKVSDALGQDLEGFISRVFIGYIPDRKEAAEACQLAGLDPERYVPRIMERPTIPQGGGAEAPNHNSLAALYDYHPDGTRDFVRGSVFYYRDLVDRAIPCEVKLTEEFLRMASTNPEDVKRRREARLAEDARNRRNQI